MGNLSRFAGGGAVFTPAMMEYDGSSYYSLSITSSGNNVRLVAQFKKSSFTGDTLNYILRVNGPSGAIRIGLAFFSSDYTTVARRNKLMMICQNSSSTNILRLFSIDDVCDGNTHIVVASFNAATADASFKIDNIDADDVANGERIAPTTGTLGAGAGTIYVGVSDSTPTYGYVGDLGFVGYQEVYTDDNADLVTVNGYPKDVDFSAWILANKHGDMENNEGTGGNAAKTGTIVVGDGGNGPHPVIGLRTAGNATAGSIEDGKIAWVDGVEITGTADIAPMSAGTKLFWDCGARNIGVPAQVASSDLYMADGVSIISQTSGTPFTRDSQGNLTTTGSYPHLRFELGAKDPGSYREYVWKMQTLGNYTQYQQLQMRFNYQDSNNYWTVRLMGLNASNTWLIQWMQVLAGVESNHSTNFTPSASFFPNNGTIFTISLIDCGDLLTMSVNVGNITTATSVSYTDGALREAYYASRSLASQTKLELNFQQNAQMIGLRSLSVMDIADSAI